MNSSPIMITIGDRAYEWSASYTNAQNHPAFAHHGVALGPDGAVYLPNAPATELLVIGERTRRVPLPVTEAHGLAVDAAEGVWIADPGIKAVPDGAGQYRDLVAAGRVVRLDARTGAITSELAGPGGWRPAAVALHDHGRADGRVWVADLGNHEVHCFSRAGERLWSSDGAGSGIPFVRPHALVVDPRGEVPALVVADLGNQRLVTLSLDGEYLRATRAGQCDSPSGLAVHEDALWVAEASGRLLTFGPDGGLLAAYGSPITRPGAAWPNWSRAGRTARPFLRPRKFRSPHGIAITANGEVFVTEWVIGGRVTRLTPVEV